MGNSESSHVSPDARSNTTKTKPLIGKEDERQQAPKGRRELEDSIEDDDDYDSGEEEDEAEADDEADDETEEEDEEESDSEDSRSEVHDNNNDDEEEEEDVEDEESISSESPGRICTSAFPKQWQAILQISQQYAMNSSTESSPWTVRANDDTDYRAFCIVLHPKHGVLLLHCTRKKNKQPHYQLPGGHIDRDEYDLYDNNLYQSAQAGAARELFEETGIDLRYTPALDRLLPLILYPEYRDGLPFTHKSKKAPHHHPLPNELKSRLFFIATLSNDEFLHKPDPNRRLTSIRNHGLDLFLPLSVEHSGFWLEPNPFKALELLQLHSGGKVSQALAMALDVTVGFVLKQPSTPERSSRRNKTPKSKPDEIMTKENNNDNDKAVYVKSPIARMAAPIRPQGLKRQASPTTTSQVKSVAGDQRSPPENTKAQSDDDALAPSSPTVSLTRKQKLCTDDAHSSMQSPLNTVSTENSPPSRVVETDNVIISPQSPSIKALDEALPTNPVHSKAESNKSVCLLPASTIPHEGKETLTEQRSPETYVSSESSLRVAEMQEPLEAMPAEGEISNDAATATSAGLCPATFDIFDMLKFPSSPGAEPITAVEPESPEPLISKVVVPDSSPQEGEKEELVPTEPPLTSDAASASSLLDSIPEDSALASVKTDLASPVEGMPEQTSQPLVDADPPNPINLEPSSSQVEEIDEFGPVESVIFSVSTMEPVEAESTMSSAVCPAMDFSTLDIFGMLPFHSSSIPNPTTSEAEVQSPEPMLSKAVSWDSSPQGGDELNQFDAPLTSEEAIPLSSDVTPSSTPKSSTAEAEVQSPEPLLSKTVSRISSPQEVDELVPFDALLTSEEATPLSSDAMPSSAPKPTTTEAEVQSSETLLSTMVSRSSTPQEAKTNELVPFDALVTFSEVAPVSSDAMPLSAPKPTIAETETQSLEPLLSTAVSMDSLPQEAKTNELVLFGALATSVVATPLLSDAKPDDLTTESINSAWESPTAMSSQTQPPWDEVDSQKPHALSESVMSDAVSVESSATEIRSPITNESPLESTEASPASLPTNPGASNIQSSTVKLPPPLSQPWASFGLSNLGIFSKISSSSPSPQKTRRVAGSQPLSSDSLPETARTRHEPASNAAASSLVISPDVVNTTPSMWYEEENGPDDENFPDEEAEDDGPDDEIQGYRSQEVVWNDAVDLTVNTDQMDDSVGGEDTLEHDEAIQEMILSDFSSQEPPNSDLEAVIQQARRDLASDSASSPEDRLEAALLRAKSSAAALQAEQEESRSATTENDQHQQRLALEADVLFPDRRPSSSAWVSCESQAETQMFRTELDQARQLAEKYTRHEAENLDEASRQSTLVFQTPLADAPRSTEPFVSPPPPHIVEDVVEDSPMFQLETANEDFLHRFEWSNTSEEQDEIVTDILDEFTTTSDIDAASIRQENKTLGSNARPTSPSPKPPPESSVAHDTKEVRLFFRVKKASKEQTSMPSDASMEQADVVNSHPDFRAKAIEGTAIAHDSIVTAADPPSTQEVQRYQTEEEGRNPPSQIQLSGTTQKQMLPRYDASEKDVEITESEFEAGADPKPTQTTIPDSYVTPPMGSPLPPESGMQPADKLHDSKEVRLFFRAKSLRARQAQKLAQKKISDNEKEKNHKKSDAEVPLQPKHVVAGSLRKLITVDSQSSPNVALNPMATSGAIHDATEEPPTFRVPRSDEGPQDVLTISGIAQGNDGAGARQLKGALTVPSSVVGSSTADHQVSIKNRLPTTPKLDKTHHKIEKSPILDKANLSRSDFSEEEDVIVEAILDVGATSRKTQRIAPYSLGRPVSSTSKSSLSSEGIPATPKPVSVQSANDDPRLFGVVSSDDRQPHTLTRSDTSEEEDEIANNILDEFTAITKQHVNHLAPTDSPESTQRVAPIASPLSFAVHQDKKGLRDSYYMIAKAKREREEAEKRRAEETLTSAQLEREASRLLSIQKLEAGIQRLEAERKELRRVEVRKATAAQSRFQQKTPLPDTALSRSGLFVAHTHQEGSSFVLLISKTSGAPTQKNNQEKTLMMLQSRKLPFVLVDGSDPSERDLRNDLFGISGIRGNYPQLFLQQQEGKISFVGDFETINNLNENGALGGLVSHGGDHDPIPRRSATASVDGTTTVNGQTLVILLSTTSGNLVQKANQDRALVLLDSSRIRPEILDGADASNLELCDHLFGVSGIRGVYPQFFLKKVATGEYSFFGTYRTIESMNDEGPLEELFG